MTANKSFTIHEHGIIDPCCDFMKYLLEKKCINLMATLPEDSAHEVYYPGLRFLDTDHKDLIEIVNKFNDTHKSKGCKNHSEHREEQEEFLEKHFVVIYFEYCPFCKAKVVRSGI